MRARWSIWPERYFVEQPKEVRCALVKGGAELAGRMEFRLVRIDSLNPSTELLEALRADQCLSQDLCGMGFVIVEAINRAPIVVMGEDSS